MPFPVDLKYIQETERELQIQFPEKFKAKMMKSNGGELLMSTNDEVDEDSPWQLFPFFDQSDRKRLSRTCNHIGLETKQMREWLNFPCNGIAIAKDSGGDMLILLPDKNSPEMLQETIFTWQHETGEIIEVASSIEQFKVC